MPRARTAALVALAVLAAPACARTTTGVGAPQASADPTTTPGSPNAQPNSSVFPPEKIDTLLLSADEVNGVIGRTPPLFQSDPDFGAHQERRPYAHDYYHVYQPEACANLFGVGTEDIFGMNWKNYRYFLFSNIDDTPRPSVEEAAAAYSTADEPRKAFEKITESLRLCGNSDGTIGTKERPSASIFSITDINASESTASWHIHSQGSSNTANSNDHFYKIAVVGNALLETSVSNVGQGDKIVNILNEKLNARLNR